MSHVPILPQDKASEASRVVYDEFYKRMAFPAPPNFIKTQGHSPTVARGTWEVVRNVLVNGQIPRWVKEMVFVAISKDRDCRYCTAAHIACCRMLGANSEFMNQLLDDPHSIADARLRDMILFALKTSRNPQSLEESDFAKLRAHGMEQPEIMELIAMSALAVYANIIADATKMDEDEMFSTL
jgi:uncharacterized peroxidase-related enzyme